MESQALGADCLCRDPSLAPCKIHHHGPPVKQALAIEVLAVQTEIVGESRFGDGSTAKYQVSDDTQQIELLRRLVAEDERGVLSFTRTGDDLEDLFMRLTEGGVR